MEEDLATLSLLGNEEAAWQVDIGDGGQEGLSELSVVGSFLTASVAQFQAMRITLANLWHPHGGVTITDIGEKRFLFQFYYDIDIDQFLDGSPCTFNNHLLIFHRLKEGEDPMMVPLFWSDFLVQIHDLPPGLMSEVMAQQFGNFLGSFNEYDVKSLNQGYGVHAYSG